jgi:hypothetical protein
MVKITGSMTGEIPYKYVGIMHLTSLEEFQKKDATSQKFQDFAKKWITMAKDPVTLIGEEIY